MHNSARLEEFEAASQASKLNAAVDRDAVYEGIPGRRCPSKSIGGGGKQLPGGHHVKQRLRGHWHYHRLLVANRNLGAAGETGCRVRDEVSEARMQRLRTEADAKHVQERRVGVKRTSLVVRADPAGPDQKSTGRDPIPDTRDSLRVENGSARGKQNGGCGEILVRESVFREH